MVGFPRTVEIGMLRITAGVLDRLACGDRHVALTLLGEVLERFRRRDWGELSSGDKKANDDELEHGGRILAVYSVRSVEREEVRIYLIQHVPFEDRESQPIETVALLPEEY